MKSFPRRVKAVIKAKRWHSKYWLSKFHLVIYVKMLSKKLKFDKKIKLNEKLCIWRLASSFYHHKNRARIIYKPSKKEPVLVSYLADIIFFYSLIFFLPSSSPLPSCILFLWFRSIFSAQKNCLLNQRKYTENMIYYISRIELDRLRIDRVFSHI
jgi:hypothetical protein